MGLAPTLFWRDADGKHYEGRYVHLVTDARHSLALGEERVYETLRRYCEDRQSDTFSLGYDRIARLVRLNEKSVRMLIPKLIGKKALEIVAPEHSAGRIGRTYRIYSDAEILARQQAAGLTHIAKSGRAVEFVQPVSPSVGV